MKKNKLIPVVVVVVFLCILVGITAVAPTEDYIVLVDTVFNPGTYNFNDSGGLGVVLVQSSDVVITADGVHFVGNDSPGSIGYNINGTPYGGLNNVTIDLTEGSVRNYSTGIFCQDASNVTIYALYAGEGLINHTDYSIYINNCSDVNISYIRMDDMIDGVYITPSSSSNVEMYNDEFYGFSSNAVHVKYDPTNVLVQNCVLSSNLVNSRGVIVEGSALKMSGLVVNSSTIIGSTTTGEAVYGNYLENALIQGNNITEGGGIYLTNGDSSVVTLNNLTGSGYGVATDGQDDTNITFNFINSSGSYGIFVQTGSNVDSLNNTIVELDATGIYYNAGDASRIVSNQVNNTIGDGIHVRYSADTNLSNNIVWSAGEHGIHIEGGEFIRSDGDAVYNSTLSGFALDGVTLYARILDALAFNNLGNGLLICGGSNYATVTGGNYYRNSLFGIFVNGSSGTSVVGTNISNLNVNITQVYNGITMSYARNSVLRNVTAYDNNVNGIEFVNSYNATISNSYSWNNVFNDIYFNSSSYIVIGENTTMSAGANYGLALDNSHHCTVADSFVVGNGVDGVVLNQSNYSTFVNVTITLQSEDGLVMLDSNYGVFHLGNITDNTETGIVVDDSDYNNVTSSHVYFNGDDGVYINNSAGNRFVDNLIHNNSLYGVWLDTSVGHVFVNNTIYGHPLSNFAIHHSNDTVSVNDTVYNADQYGAWVEVGLNSTFIGLNSTWNTLGGVYTLVSAETTIVDSDISHNSWVGIIVLRDTDDLFSGNRIVNNTAAGIWSDDSSVVNSTWNNITFTRAGFKLFWSQNITIGIANLNTSGYIDNNRIWLNNGNVSLFNRSIGIFDFYNGTSATSISNNTVYNHTMNLSAGIVTMGNVTASVYGNLVHNNTFNMVHLLHVTFSNLSGATFRGNSLLDPIISGATVGAIGGVTYYDTVIDQGSNSSIYATLASTVVVVNSTFNASSTYIVTSGNISEAFYSEVHVISSLDGLNVSGAVVNSTNNASVLEWSDSTDVYGRTESAWPWNVNTYVIDYPPGGRVNYTNVSNTNFSACKGGVCNYTVNTTDHNEVGGSWTVYLGVVGYTPPPPGAGGGGGGDGAVTLNITPTELNYTVLPGGDCGMLSLVASLSGADNVTLNYTIGSTIREILREPTVSAIRTGDTTISVYVCIPEGVAIGSIYSGTLTIRSGLQTVHTITVNAVARAPPAVVPSPIMGVMGWLGDNWLWITVFMIVIFVIVGFVFYARTQGIFISDYFRDLFSRH